MQKKWEELSPEENPEETFDFSSIHCILSLTKEQEGEIDLFYKR